jgi:hypothetical protein
MIELRHKGRFIGFDGGDRRLSTSKRKRMAELIVVPKLLCLYLDVIAF